MFNFYAKLLSKLLLDEEFMFSGARNSEPPEEAMIVPLAKGIGSMFYLVLVVDADALPRAKYDAIFEAFFASVPALLESDFERIIYLTLFVTSNDSFSVSHPEFIPDQTFYNVQWIVDLSSNTVKIPEGAPPNILKIRNLAQKALSAYNADHADTPLPSFGDLSKNVIKSKYSVSYKPYATYAILIINLIVWGCMEIFGSSTDSYTLVAFGATIHPLNPEWSFYRLFSSMFLHIGIVHLAYNSLALYIFGIRFERFYGSYVFLLVYVLSGLSASFFSMFFSAGISAGASAAILGLAGALIVMGAKYKVTFQGLNTYAMLIMSIAIIALGFVEKGVNNLGHIIGFAAGMLTAYIFNLINSHRNNQKELEY